MAGLHRLWNDVWPVLVSVSSVGLPAFGWQHWRITAKLDRHQFEVTAIMDRKLRVKVEVDPAGPVTIIPAPDIPVTITPVSPTAEDSEPKQ